MAGSNTDDIAELLVSTLIRHGQQIVFAESCTAGLISASMARIPGVSAVLTGSAVVYQVPTKQAWLKIDQQLLQDPGPVSREVAEQMALNVLQQTPHATIAASVTGHLGPGAPVGLDAVAWTSVANRQADSGAIVIASTKRLQLCPTSEDSGVAIPSELQQANQQCVRHERQEDAVRQVLLLCLEVLQTSAVSLK